MPPDSASNRAAVVCAACALIDRDELGRIVYDAEIEANRAVQHPAIAASTYASYDDLPPALQEIECRVGEAVQARIVAWIKDATNKGATNG